MHRTIAIGSDHAGFELKEHLLAKLRAQLREVKDFGTFSADSVDYADFAHPVAVAVGNGEFHVGILVCGSGQGVCMAANRHANVRAALCWNPEMAELARRHNDANILCLPARFLDHKTAVEAIAAFFNHEFEGGRHGRRVEKIEFNGQ
ncbi:MAG: ribose 5-phosphate isomerase B [Hymenobacteraceae bacterium]|nr:ribose 5-phosphate isomerase B [Hymenobacteraceae bacterium]